MSYITNDDIELRVGSAAFVQLADDNGDGAADVAVVDELREAAEGEINSYLARRYQTPIDLDLHSELGALLKSVALDVAEYRLRMRRPPVSEEARRRYEQCLQWFVRIAEGVIVLPSLAQVGTPSNRGIVAATIGEHRVLSRDELSTS